MRKRSVHCTHCCRSCCSHFSSLAAFDAHLKGRAGERTCVDPHTVERLIAKTQSGVCELRAGYLKCVGVTVWTLKSSRSGAAERLARVA